MTNQQYGRALVACEEGCRNSMYRSFVIVPPVRTSLLFALLSRRIIDLGTDARTRATMSAAVTRISGGATRRALRSSPATRSFSSAAASAKDVVIVGSGIMGLNIAYQLRRRDPAMKITVLERASALGAGSSGYSTGFQRAYYSFDETMGSPAWSKSAYWQRQQRPPRVLRLPHGCCRSALGPVVSEVR